MATNNLNAILNYAGSYSTVKELGYLGKYSPDVKNGVITAGNYAKIVFTGDGHIISHGIDYTPTFGDPNHSVNPLAKGLVPASDFLEGQKIKFLGNKGLWFELTTAELPMAQNYADGQQPGGDKVIYNASQVYELFNKTISAIDVMRFKGEFDASADNPFANGVCESGDTYRVSKSGKYAGFTLNPGDLLICIKDSASNTTAADLKDPDNKFWMVVESNIDGTTLHWINGVPHLVFTNNPDPSGDAFKIFAPTSGGTSGQVLISNGTSAPVWKNSSELDLLSNDWKSKIVGSISVANNGNMTWKAIDGKTTLGSYTPNVTEHIWNISIAGKSNGTNGILTTDTGLAFDTGSSFDGSESKKLILTKASKTAIGGVIVDNRTTDQNDKNFLYPNELTISVNDGVIFLTKENIANALGFVPGSTENVYAYNQVVTSSATTVVADNATDPFLNLTSKRENSTKIEPVASTQFQGINGIKITGQAGKILFDLLEANTTTYGGIKIFKKNTAEIAAKVSDGTRSDRYYGVELDNAGKAFVYVPWVDENPAFNKVVVSGGTNGKSGEITASGIDSQFTLSAGNGINLVLADANNIIINQDVWEVVKTTKMGYAPAMTKETDELTKGHYMLAFKDGDSTASWHKLPLAAFSDTWRAIQVSGNVVANNNAIDANGAVIGSALNFTATGDHNKTTLSYVASTLANTPHVINIFSSWRDIYAGIKDDDNKLHEDYSLVLASSDDLAVRKITNPVQETESISFELVWYNIDKDAAEMVKE